MKSCVITTMMLFSFVIPSRSQTWAEWFNQKKTQKKYLLEQIAALKVYTDYAKKGYRIVKDGSRLIGDIKNGDFSLHKDYFSSLKTVNPAIKRQDKVAHMFKLQTDMSLIRQKLLGSSGAAQLSAEQKGAVIRRLADLSAEAAKDLDELNLIITGGQLELSDDQRIARIDVLYKRVTDAYGYHKKLSDAIASLISTQGQLQLDAATLKALYGKKD